MLPKYDCIIIGGGSAAAHAAFPLVEAGFEVLMLDGGIKSPNSFDSLKDMDFDSIRREVSDQHLIFLGNDISGALPLDGGDQTGHMTTGRFSYVIKQAEKFLPVQSDKFYLAQTLAKGGMTEVWGGASDALDEEELKAVGLPVQEMKKHYEKIIDRIGISGPIKNYKTQPSAMLSTHAKQILEKFNRHRDYFDKLGMKIFPSTLALLTEDKGNRKKTSYTDTDYWLDGNKSLYRARFTIEELQLKNNFHYMRERVVTSLSESNNGVSVKTLDFSKNENIYNAKYAVVAAGALNTARILLKSLNLYDKKVRITSKPHIITPCIDLRFLGKVEDGKKHSLCQLMLESSNKINGFYSFSSQLYTYKSLLLFKLLNFVPFTKPESIGLLSLFVPSMMVVDSRFPSSLDEYKTCELNKSENGDMLHIKYRTNKEELSIIKDQMKIIKKGLIKLDLIPLKQVYMPEGTSAHYAGGVSTSLNSNSPLKADMNGKLQGFSKIFIADASLWKAISAKPPTLTIMANADRIGSNLVKIMSL
jgi:choline dehydrogenase-like flavoprotein